VTSYVGIERLDMSTDTQTDIRTFTTLDRVLESIGEALEAVAGRPAATRPSPGDGVPAAEMDDRERRHAAGLMRVNHTGEVCAQALYNGQAVLARDADTRTHLEHAAAEETDHLAWCAARLAELDSRPSLLNPLWYAGSFAIGAAAAAVGDRISLGFVVETERQVEAHLAEHIERLPAQDARSRAILSQMQADEIRHADNAQARGGIDLPPPVPTLMRCASAVMKAIAYRV
jgi:ubiquinone biosynthesis monooxygenase Coq7